MGIEKRGSSRRGLELGVLLLGLMAWAPAFAEDFSGRVVAVVSGDVVDVLKGGHRLRVRLAGVSCPGRRKPYGNAARQFTAGEALDRVVTVLDRGGSRGLRQGEVTLPGNRSLSRELVRNGWARWNRSPDGDSYLGVLEDDARAARRGLWAQADHREPDRPAPQERRRKR